MDVWCGQLENGVVWEGRKCGANAVSVESGNGLPVLIYSVQAICQNILDRGEIFGLQSIPDRSASWSAVGVVSHHSAAGVVWT